MTTLYAKKEGRFGTTINLFAAGKVSISSEGMFDVESEEIAREVIETYPDDFGILENTIEEVVVETTTQAPVTVETTTEAPIADTITETTTLAPENEDLKKKAEENEFGKTDGNDVGGSDEKDQLIKSLEGKTLGELKELAKPFPKTEWKTKNAIELTAYLTAKILS